jgi:hypothetical protein
MVARYRSREPDAATLASITRTYEASFPPSQRVPFATLLSSVRRGRRTLWLDDDRLAFAVTLPLETSDDDVLLEYLAVDVRHRSSGRGGQILDHIVRVIASRLVLEIEDPDHERTVDSRRRVSFYEAHGGRAIVCAHGYAVPDLHGSTRELTPMILHEIPPDPAAELRGKELRTLVTRIWVESYGMSPRDPRLARILENFMC